MTSGDRAHHFWGCVVAEALRDVLREHGGVDFARHHLWLAQAPAGLMQAVWDIVCLAAVAAMEYGRQRLYACREDSRVGIAVVRRIGVEVVSDFWARLAAFVSLRRPPRRWDLVPSNHPFLASDDMGGVVLVGPATDSPPASP